MYLVFACLFSCTALFVSISQVIGCEDRLRNDLYCVGWGVELYSLTHSDVWRSSTGQNWEPLENGVGRMVPETVRTV